MPRKRKPAPPLELSAEWLLQLIETRQIVRHPLLPPSLTACGRLAFALMGLQAGRTIAPLYAETEAARRRFVAALDELAEASMAIRRQQEQELEFHAEPGSSLLELNSATAEERPDLLKLDEVMDGWTAKAVKSHMANLAALDGLAAAITVMRECRGCTMVHDRPVNWHGMVGELAEKFREAMRSSNPGHVLGLHGDSPLARFLAEIVPHLTGETPSGPAVMSYLRSRSANKTGG